MTRLLPALLSLVFLLPITAAAQQQGDTEHSARHHSAMNDVASPSANAVTEGGQSAFAAIAEIVSLLAADQTTD